MLTTTMTTGKMSGLDVTVRHVVAGSTVGVLDSTGSLHQGEKKFN